MSTFILPVHFSIALLFFIFNIKICPMQLLFSIPCPGCGLTRSFICLLQGDVKQSLYYNILGLVFVLSGIIGIIVSLFDRQKFILRWLKKHRRIVLIFVICLTGITWYFNICHHL